MITYLYDGTYAGLLTTIFETYTLKSIPDRIIFKENYSPMLGEEIIEIITCEEKAQRVLKGVCTKSSEEAAEGMLKVFLSETDGVEMILYKYIKHLMSSRGNAERDYLNTHVLKVQQIKKQIHREVHRMHAFVRFEKINDIIYYSPVEPDFNVLPLIGDHFEKRYADQCWLIFDTRRNYGIYYNLSNTVEIYPEDMNMLFAKVDSNGGGINYQVLWRTYFDSVNITERKNMKSHLRHLPKRYWKFLVEKNKDLTL